MTHYTFVCWELALPVTVLPSTAFGMPSSSAARCLRSRAPTSGPAPYISMSYCLHFIILVSSFVSLVSIIFSCALGDN